ncbi:MAG: hypothetical protein DWQ44_06055 [Bacteroidetes bacterium]|nr:MAG: hypothetical protein DWQ33_12985 [Bacteroidota bacterium]REK03420.1 MAG: hypothetical protein DWQ39_09465 [Bacteroidota bacterium]REK34468.1 MAG: hypothetical protein DWQ44_06055 [Bacteroidota bacterium]REK50414.1 MAG: hypothetical protein DWQ48_03615 [Bacteroidota bacterium]
MKKVFLLSISLLFELSAITQEAAAMAPFTKIKLNAISTLYIKEASIHEVRVSPDAKKDALQLDVKSGTLYLSGAGADVYVSLPVLEEISVGGKASVKGENVINGNSLRIAIGGDGKVDMDVNVKNLTADISGLGKVLLRGQSDEANINISGSGKVDAMGMRVSKCNANISGLGKCMIDVRDELNSNISGSGVVTYKERPAILNENISGVGSTKQVGAAAEKDTTHLNFGSTEVLIIGDKKSKEKKEEKAKPIWSGLELGLNGYMNRDAGFDIPDGFSELELKQSKSVFVALNLLQKDFEIAKSNIWFTTGLGLAWNNYRFDNEVILMPTEPISVMRDVSTTRSYSKSKLTCSYLTAPLMLQAFTSREQKKAFHIGAGAILGLKIGSHTKVKYEENGNEFKSKVRDDFNLSTFRYGFRVNVGYGKFNLFADYYASTLFSENKGPTLYPVTAGITLVGF